MKNKTVRKQRQKKKEDEREQEDEGEKLYAVGYGKAPEHSKFKPGQSGNPRGRPKKRRSFVDELAAEMCKPITVTENGKKKRITKQQAIVKQTMNKAMSGDPKVIALLMSPAFRQALEMKIEQQNQALKRDDFDDLDLSKLSEEELMKLYLEEIS